MKKKWIFKPNNDDLVNELIEKYNISILTAKVLQNRLSELSGFLGLNSNDIYEKIHSPYLLNDMEKAVSAVEEAVMNGDKITVYGDYDVDGITSTAIIYSYLESVGANVDYYIPDRIEEGYGINEDALLMLKNRGTDFIVTVDTGISAYEQIKYAYELGMKVVVTDHHECPEIIPECEAVINPKRKDSTYPFKNIAGVAVAFKLVCALNEDIYEMVDSYVDLVCIGTIADVMPLVNENRAFATLGLLKLQNSENVGINALIENAGISERKIDSVAVSFMISPRINACGRLENANKAVEMLITDNYNVADSTAKWLCEINSKRQTMESKIFEEAVKIIEDNQLYRERVIVCANEGWHHGIIGIVASKIMEKYYRPTVLLTVDGDETKGSSRSIKGFDIYDGLTAVSDLLVKFGGHSLAAGLTLKTENIVNFRNEINKYAAKVTKREDYIPELTIDSDISISDITEENILDILKIEPFGNGNPSPVFSVTGGILTNIALMSNGKHLRLRITKDGLSLNAVGFGMGEYYNYLNIGDAIDICGSLGINEYNNTKTVQMILKDIRKPRKEE